MDSEAKDIVGRVVYPFYHPTDIFQIQKLHSKCEYVLLMFVYIIPTGWLYISVKLGFCKDPSLLLQQSRSTQSQD
jgi:hypothetical protein